MTDLIVNFPPQRQRRNNKHRVRFAAKAAVYTFERHFDNKDKVARHELWYTKAEYGLMKLKLKEDVLNVQAKASDGSPFNYSGEGDDDVCCIGIEHQLTPACTRGVRDCRMRCIFAVVSEQARQSSSARFRWEAIALASIAQTRWVALRARKLGNLHRESI